jgi:hypothetical protein
MVGSEYCYAHNPTISHEEKMREWGKGGIGQIARVEEPLPPMKLETTEDVIMLLGDTINRVRAGGLDVRIANCIGVLSGHLLKAFEITELKEKLEIIETAVLKKRKEGWGK